MTSRSAVRKLISHYNKIKPRIKKRLSLFRRLHKEKDDRIFAELCYCILTANANALMCDKAVKELESGGLLLKGSAARIIPKLKGRVRFHNKKAGYITGARSLFTCKGRLDLKSRLDLKDIIATRDWLVENVKGYGYKEASHFLRNIGLGRDIAILDRHILKNLKKYGVIDKVPDSTGSRALYMTIEDKMRRFSKKIDIPLEEMDLLFWSIETGFVFK